MTAEQLKQLGLSDDVVTSVLKLHTDSINGTYIPKHRFDEVNTELKAAKATITERDGQLETLKGLEGASDELKKQIAALEETNKKQAAEYAAKLESERKANSIKSALLLSENKPHDVDLILGLLDANNIKLGEDGKLSGLEEQLTTMRKEKGFLFSTEKGSSFNPFGAKPKDGETPPPPKNDAESYGKSLAASKLEMLGVSQENKN